MRAPLRLGLHFHTPATPGRSRIELFRETIEQAVVGESLGYDSVWPVEQHFDADVSLLSSPMLLLAAIAERTSTMRLGTAITVAALHHPARIAEDVGTLDVLSAGRAECGLGRGMDPVQFAGLGRTPPADHDGLAQTVAALRAAWGGDPGSTVTPRPVQQAGPPIRIAANTPATFRYAGQAGLPILVATHTSPPDVLGGLLTAYRRAQEDAGHSPAADDVTVLAPVFVDDDPHRLRALVAPSVDRLAANMHRKLREWHALAPPGPAGERTRARLAELGARLGSFDYDRLVDRGLAVFDTPAAAAERLRSLACGTTAGRVICWLNPGGRIPHGAVLESMAALAEAALRVGDRVAAGH